MKAKLIGHENNLALQMMQLSSFDRMWRLGKGLSWKLIKLFSSVFISSIKTNLKDILADSRGNTNHSESGRLNGELGSEQASSGDHRDSLDHWLWGDYGGVDCGGGGDHGDSLNHWLWGDYD